MVPPPSKYEQLLMRKLKSVKPSKWIWVGLLAFVGLSGWGYFVYLRKSTEVVFNETACSQNFKSAILQLPKSPSIGAEDQKNIEAKYKQCLKDALSSKSTAEILIEKIQNSK